MTQKPKTEEEQVAFFESVHERFRKAAENAGEIHYDYRIAGEEPKVSDTLKRAKEAMLRARLPLPPRTDSETPVDPLPSPAGFC